MFTLILILAYLMIGAAIYLPDYLEMLEPGVVYNHREIVLAIVLWPIYLNRMTPGW